MNVHKGSCLCGEIRYQVNKIQPKVGHCHCSMCRKFHGSAFSTFGEAAVDDFQWLAGESQLEVYTAVNGTRRKFCRRCGASLVFVPSQDEGKVVEFSLGTLDTPIKQRPDAHIYVASKAQWFDISDALPKFDCGRTGSSE